MAEIFKELKERYDFLVQKYGEDHILGIFLYGSQNYKLDTPNSDIDTKVIYVPSLWEISLNKAPISKELHYKDTHIEVKDVRLMCEMWKKQNINFVEILFTDYKIINPKYERQWELFNFYKESIAYYDVNKTIISVSHQAFNTIRKDIVTNKQFVNAARLDYFLQNYIKREKYLDCIVMPKDKLKFYRRIKENKASFTSTDLAQVRAHLEDFTKYKTLKTVDGDAARQVLDNVMGNFVYQLITENKI